jgi:hypothetical protein
MIIVMLPAYLAGTGILKTIDFICRASTFAEQAHHNTKEIIDPTKLEKPSSHHRPP